MSVCGGTSRDRWFEIDYREGRIGLDAGAGNVPWPFRSLATGYSDNRIYENSKVAA